MLTQTGSGFSYFINYSHLIIYDKPRLAGISHTLRFIIVHIIMLNRISIRGKLVVDKTLYFSQLTDRGGVTFDKGCTQVTYLHKTTFKLLSAKNKIYMKAGNLQ